MSVCATVQVKNDKSDSGYSVINESDFVKGEHSLYVEPKKKATRKVAVKTAE